MSSVASLGTSGAIRFPGGLLQLWIGDAMTSGGVATFYPTADGTAAGMPCFSSIAAAFPAAELATGTMTAVPHATLKAVAGDLKSVTVNCSTATVLGVLGATALAAPDGTLVHLLILGT